MNIGSMRPIAMTLTPAQREFYMCHRKRKYASEKDAKAGDGRGLDVYHCPVCHQWHQTHPRNRPRY